MAEPVHASRAVQCHRRDSSAVTTFWKWSQWPPGRGGDGRGQAAGGGGAEPREHGRLPPATAACAGLRGRRLLPGPQEATSVISHKQVGSVTGDMRPRRRAACEQHGTVTINCPSAHGGLSHPLTRAPSPAAGWTPAPQGHGLLRDGEGPRPFAASPPGQQGDPPVAQPPSSKPPALLALPRLSGIALGSARAGPRGQSPRLPGLCRTLPRCGSGPPPFSCPRISAGSHQGVLY